MYKANEANGANRILSKTTINVPLEHLSNFWRSLKITMINCKVELKLKWTKHCVLASNAADIMIMLILIILFLLSKTQNCMSLLSLYQQKNNQKLWKRLYRGIKNQCIGINIKQKVRIKILQMSIDIFLNQKLWELNDCLH